MPVKMRKEIMDAVHSVMTRMDQPAVVRDQFLKLLQNLMEGNYESRDVSRMVESIVIEDGKED